MFRNVARLSHLLRHGDDPSLRSVTLIGVGGVHDAAGVERFRAAGASAVVSGKAQAPLWDPSRRPRARSGAVLLTTSTSTANRLLLPRSEGKASRYSRKWRQRLCLNYKESVLKRLLITCPLLLYSCVNDGNPKKRLKRFRAPETVITTFPGSCSACSPTRHGESYLGRYLGTSP